MVVLNKISITFTYPVPVELETFKPIRWLLNATLNEVFFFILNAKTMNKL